MSYAPVETPMHLNGFRPMTRIGLMRFHKIATQARAEMAANKEAIGLSRVHLYESKGSTTELNNTGVERWLPF